MSKRKLYNSLFILLYWIVAVNFLVILQVTLIKGFMLLAGIDEESLTDQMAIYWVSPSQFIEGILAGVSLAETIFLKVDYSLF